MNPNAILALISDLYGQVAALTAERADLIKQNEELRNIQPERQ